MNISSRLWIVLLRLSLGWLFLYAGVTKIINPSWSSAGYLKGAKTFSGFYDWFLQPSVLPITDFLNEWGLTLIGISLILGVAVRFSGIAGAILMMLYYFPVLDFPYIGTHSYIVEEHIIYALALLVLATSRAGKDFGLDGKLSRIWIFRHLG